MKKVRCAERGEVVIILEKGSQIKPDLYIVHECCPNLSSQDGVESPP